MINTDFKELVTVIIPVYNVENNISYCLESVLKQTYKNIEILIIDDGSTDNSYDICQKYAENDKRITLLRQTNQGIAFVRNRGVEQAKGNLIFWIDSDDYIKCDIIEKLYNNLVEYNADMSVCDYIKGSETDYSFTENKDIEIECFDNKKGLELIYKNDHFSFTMAASWAKLIKKELYKDLYYPDGKIFEDIYMSHHLIQKCKKIVYTNEIMYYYFQWPESILGKKLHIAKLDYLGAFEERIHFFKQLNYEEISEKAYLQYLHSLMWEYSRAKEILKNKSMVKNIKRKYRQYYRFGISNPEYKHETSLHMFSFYISPWLTELAGKIKLKLRG